MESSDEQYLKTGIFDDIYDVNKEFIRGFWEREAVAVDKTNYICVTNSCESEEKRHIGRYSPEGKFLSDLYAKGMRNRYSDRMYLRGLFVDSNGRDIIVLQRFGNLCKVWKYSNVFAN